MHHDDLSRWQHSHQFAGHAGRAERRTRIVIAITATMMIVEIAAGSAYNSMALLADGWHMSTHVAAFLITAIAYAFSRRRAADPRYSFGTGKVGVLGGYTSAILLAMVALLMAVESLRRMWSPAAINFDHAIAVAAIGLAVNLVCAWLLKDDPSHHHGHGHGHAHGHGAHAAHAPHGQAHGDGHHHRHAHDGPAPAAHRGHRDLNLRAAYVHVLADALTSVTAIVALIGGKLMGWNWLDPMMGLVGSAVVALWARSLLRDTGGVLLDRTPADTDLPAEIRRAIESDDDARITDLHVWQIGSGRFAAIVAIAAHAPLEADAYRARLAEHEELVHVSIETRRVCGHGPDHEERAAPAGGLSTRTHHARRISPSPVRAAG